MLLLCPLSVTGNITLSYLTQLTVIHSMNGLECSGKAYKTLGQKSSTFKSEYGCTYCFHSPDNSPINNFIKLWFIFWSDQKGLWAQLITRSKPVIIHSELQTQSPEFRSHGKVFICRKVPDSFLLSFPVPVLSLHYQFCLTLPIVPQPKKSIYFLRPML